MSTGTPLGAVVRIAAWLLTVGVSIAADPATGNKEDRRATDVQRAAHLEFFEKQVRPILVHRCHECHGGGEQEGGLRLEAIATILAGGDTGPAIVPGKPKESLLIEAIGYGPDSYQMPPSGKLPEEEIATLIRWVQLGAPWPEEEVAASAPSEVFDLAERKKHWCWRPVVDHPPPPVRDTHWPQSPIDHFILARLESAGIAPAAPADRHALIRRVTFDLIGLPPTPAEVSAFVADDSPDALAKVVDRLLASPQYGERWARHWLDLVRYGESRGHEFDYDAPNAYQYRDYVIRALNADVPYDQFVKEHVAGDLLPAARRHPTKDFNESVLGTGFWFLGEWCHSPVDTRKDEADRFDNMIDVMSKTFLGLTVSCARCHDHKFDAIGQRDYYALAGFLQSSTYRQVRFESIDHNQRIARELDALRQRHRGPILQAVGSALVDGLADFDEYLLAAYESAQPPAGKAEADGDGNQDQIAAVARRKGLDAGRLTRLIEHLAVAGGDHNDPLHGWAEICATAARGLASESNDSAATAKVLEDVKRRQQRSEEMLDEADVLFDFATASSSQWIQDGFTFGPRPQRPGDVEWSDDVVNPVERLFTAGVAARDPAWKNLTLAAGTQTGPGLQEKIPLAGRTIRTPTFTVTRRHVCCLVEGAGQAYVVVNSHRMNQGPLHGRLIAESPNEQTSRWHWISSDLRLCQGREAHVEFTPRGDGPFSARMVVQCEQPPEYVSPPNQVVTSTLHNVAQRSIPALAGAYRQMLADTAMRLATDEIADADQASDRARLANWMIGHRDLLLTNESAWRDEIAKVAAPLIRNQRKLSADIQHGSRTAMAMLDGFGEDEDLLIRGNHTKPGPPVPRRFLEAVAGDEPCIAPTGSGRLHLARALTERSNPLPARVMVNRLWQYHFGSGIVGSPDNFGALGQPPTHPELLDYLATRFMESGWSIKQMHRLMLLSSTYQMSSTASSAAAEADPANKLWHKMPVRRLEAEAVRDAVLAVSGRLDLTMFGPSVPTHLTPFMTGRGRPKDSGPLDGAGRRSIYIAVRRNFITPMFLAFDFPTPFSTMGRRSQSNVPAQALTMMNNPFVAGQARHWAEQLIADADVPARQRIESMYLTAYARPPTSRELESALAFVAAQQDDDEGTLRTWSELCHVLMNTKEFIFLR